MHPSLRGHIALAQAVLAALKVRGAFGWPEEEPAPVIDPAECASHFSIGPTDWVNMCDNEQAVLGTGAMLSYDPVPRREAGDALKAAADQIEAGAAPEATGLPNVGIPAPVPAISPAEIGISSKAGPGFSPLPWMAAPP